MSPRFASLTSGDCEERSDKRHAIFLSLTDNYAYLFNALLNSVELFGIGKYCDIIVLHDDSITEPIIDFYMSMTESLDTDVIFHRVQAVPGDSDLGKVMTIKFYRYKVMSEIGLRYDSICFLDTDIYFASDIREYFEIAAKTDLFVGVNDNVLRHYRAEKGKGTSPGWADSKEPLFENEIWDGKFICNVPTFIDMRKYASVFYDVFEHRRKLGMDSTWPFTGDLETMNLVMIKNGIKENLVVLPSHLWTGVHYSIYRVSTMVKRVGIPANIELTDTKFKSSIIFMSETYEHVRAFHGRDWTSANNEDRIKNHNIPKLLGQMEGSFEGKTLEKAAKKRCATYDIIQAYMLFLEFNCSVSLDDLVSVVEVKQYDYLKKRQKALESRIESFTP